MRCHWMEGNGNDSSIMPNTFDFLSTSHVTHPAMIGLSPLQQAEVVLSGYRDCAAEAVRYLIEVEHMSSNDPIVIGLQNHLSEKQRHLDFVQILLHHHQGDTASYNDSGISTESETDDHVIDLSDVRVQTDISQDTFPYGIGSHVVRESSQDDSSTLTALAEELLTLIDDSINEKLEEKNEQ